MSSLLLQMYRWVCCCSIGYGVGVDETRPRIRHGSSSPWASEIRQGDFSARLPATNLPIRAAVRDINRLAEWLESLAADQEAQLLQQQSRLARILIPFLRFEDRSAIANELHDSLAQSLASLKIRCGSR
ncbi:MAG: hypothetical protein CM1200mP41_00080 [Gammaproteobacteria bacterium]|nr:MAG: hypothetical protein CM1200mP41_00080 [Gammaproteobacteria bacterium]